MSQLGSGSCQLEIARRGNDNGASKTPTMSGTCPSGTRLRRRLRADGGEDIEAAQRAADGHVRDLAAMDPAQWKAVAEHPDRLDLGNRLDRDGYLATRAGILRLERGVGFDSRCRVRATSLEQQASSIIQALRRRDEARVYDCAEHRRGHAGQTHRRFAGDRFLSNLNLIHQTALFDVARHMPKGAHLHIHYNACLPPRVLLDVAKGMDRMFVTSDLPLVADGDFDKCEMQFSILSPGRETPGDLFSPGYQPRQTMRFADFLTAFPRHYGRATADQWLADKLMFHEEETYGLLQTAAGAWEKFNGRTRMMKGLFNYETAYRRYTRLFLEDLMRDNIQYAEIRPNFMTSNQLYRDDGSGPIDNWGIMRMIIDEVNKFQADVATQGRFFGGLKVIYCTPRVFSPREVEVALDECLRFKKHWPEWIAGFDLLGEEAKGRPLKDFIDQLLAFKKNCAAEGLDIPFLFHCGETLDTGTDTDENLVDALLLGSRRIGHGFALARHPYVMQQMKAHGVCVELCPISNEVLGLTPRVGGHAMYALLANNVHCTVSSDNGTIFRSTLSHDFYQVMVGKADMDLYGWKQLVLWSIEHACLTDGEKDKILRQWEAEWEVFLAWVVERYGAAARDEAE
ncbi:Adenosine deaminase-like protein [Tolypocladium capitatum]|uniref:adenosine deaminase n=1 Tax=Tolypocladium capitatum TaxID=45235 RepID=A0A2K3QJB9_9HYPO|nr:Adenosine deaminase-like protein [Tolypocladium capitatum]